MRRKNSCDNTSLVNSAYIKLNKEGRLIEHNFSTALPTLLKLYDKDNYDSHIDRFDCIGPSRSFYSVQSGAVGKTRDLPLQSKRILSIEEKLIRVKENIVLAKAEAFDHFLSKFDNNTQVKKTYLKS